jgi:murein tripeptide amidase MpaA
MFSALKLLHGALIAKNPLFVNLLDQNIFYFVPIVNPDGVALIEREFGKTSSVLKKRKNMNPNAAKSTDTGIDC